MTPVPLHILGAEATRGSNISTLACLQEQARLLDELRLFMRRQGVLEAQVPLIRSVAAADAGIKHIEAGGGWLHSSPEAALKLLLAQSAKALYYLGPVFRRGEYGSWHRPEFTMLEWYMPGYDTLAIKDQLALLLDATGLDMPAIQVLDYCAAFQQYCGVKDPMCDAAEIWREAVLAHGMEYDPERDYKYWRDLLLSHYIIPELGHQHPVLLHGFPHQQSLQSRLLPGTHDRDDRFELIICGVEIADGCRELNDARQLMERQDNPDPLLLQAMQLGLPDCAGVALGVDRLLAVLRHRQGHKLQLRRLLDWGRADSPP